MAKFRASPSDVHLVEELLRADPNLRHIRVRARADVLTLESGEANAAVPHARFRRVSAQCFRLEMPTHTGKWQPTPLRGLLVQVLADALAEFGWMFESVGTKPGKD